MTAQQLLDALSQLTPEQLQTEVYIGVVGIGLQFVVDVFHINGGIIIETKKG